MKATLEFQLPEERVEHLIAVRAQDMRSALKEIENECRLLLKTDLTQERLLQALRDVREMCIDSMSGIE